MRLSELLNFDDITIQCHDIPDADAIASGFALYQYYKNHGKKVKLIYSGKLQVTKSNLLLMITELHIPLNYVNQINAETSELLITVDCQYGEGNVTQLPAKNVAMIDHHECCVQEGDMTEIRSGYGSCATVVYRMLLDENVNVNEDRFLATALYYGLYMDTNGFGEVRHPYDMDVMEDMHIYGTIIDKMRNSNFSMDEMKIAGVAMSDYKYNEMYRFALVKSAPCDPNLLGMINDVTLQVDKIDSCVVYTQLPNGYKLSVRSCTKDLTANEIATYITEKIGNGGGHKNKAGGFISKGKYEEIYSKLSIEEYLEQKIQELYQSFETIDVTKEKVSTDGMKRYQKLPIEIGYVRSTEIAPENTHISVRTLEGDVAIQTSENTYLMIGVKGEVYPCERARFEKDYDILEGDYNRVFEYQPRVKSVKTAEVYALCEHAHLCRRKYNGSIYAKQLDRMTKLFTKWDYDNYMYGEKEDYLAVREDDPGDVYIIQSYIFDQTYKEV